MTQPPPYGEQPGQPADPPPYQPPPYQPTYEPPAGQPAYPQSTPPAPPVPTYPAPTYPAPTYPAPTYPAPTYPGPAAEPGYPGQAAEPGYPSQPAYPPAPAAYPSAPGYPAQPGYPPPPPGYPGYPGQPGFPGAVAPPPKKSNAGKIILIIAIVLVVLCGGLVVGGYLIYRNSGLADAANTHLTTPTSLGGRPKIQDPRLETLMQSAINDLKSDLINPKATVGALYGDPDTLDLLIVVAVQGTVTDPAGEIDGAFKQLATDSASTTSNVKNVDAGPLGGSAKCGDIEEGDAKLGLCAWADHGSIGAIFLYNKSAAALAADFVAMRGQIEQRD